MTSSDFLLGYNQGWLATYYGSDMSMQWPAATGSYAGMAVRDALTTQHELSADDEGIDGFFRLVRECGGQLVRLWAFENYDKEGCAVASEGGRRSIVGLGLDFQACVHRVMQAAARHEVQVYWTALVGNWARHWNARTVPDIQSWKHLHYNILNNRYGALHAYNDHALGPFVQLLSAYSSHVYALDLMNEVQGSLRVFWSGDWERARRWVETERAFVKNIMPSLKVTASSGHHTAASDMLDGRFSDLGLDFYDLHLYNDQGYIPRIRELGRLALADATPLFLGEFGQCDPSYDDRLQTRLVRGFVQRAYDHGFLGALGWRLDDFRPGCELNACRHTYVYPVDNQEQGRVYYARPSVRVIQKGVRS